MASQYHVSFCCTTKWISHMHTYVPISPPSWASLPSSLSHPSRPPQRTELIFLCYAAASHQPTILHSVAYIRPCYSHFAPATPSHPMSSSPFSMSTSLFLPCKGSSVPFFFIPYICISIRYLFFSFWLTSLCMTDSRSIHLTTNNFVSFYGWVIFHCIYVPHLLYPFICRWTFRLVPCPGYCK